MARTGSRLIAAFLLLIGLLALKPWLTMAPSVLDSAAAGFDTGRALQRLARVLGDQRPHPVDSAADDAVRARLLAELRAIGLNPRVQDSWACNGAPKARAIGCARVRNVVASLGPATGSHLLLSAHYDSTGTGPGAADDGIGVAALLEIAAQLRGRELARPVDFLFDEGEEAGLIGARAFLEHDPAAPKVNSLINIEARGVTGPAIMFETSRPNGAALDIYRGAARRPVANSMTTDFYRLIPNATDVSVFAARPWTILNYAIIGNETRYHSASDRLDALDPRSVGHIGSEALAAVEALAAAPPTSGHGDYVYADLLGRSLLVLPRTPALAGFGVVLLLVVALAWRRRAGLGRAVAATATALAGSAAAAFLLQHFVWLLRPGLYWRAHPDLIAFALDLTALAVAAAALMGLARPLARDRLRVAFWLLFLLISLLVAVAATGGVIFALLPPLPWLAGAALDRRLPGAETAAAILSCVLLFLLWAPLLHLSEVLLDFQLAPVFAAISALLVLPALIELKPLAARLPPLGITALPALAALAGWIIVALAPAYSADRKQSFRIDYAWDQHAHTGRWLVLNDGAPLPAHFPNAAAFRKGAEVPWSTAKRLAAPAPTLPLAAPRLETIGERRTPEGGRVITVRIASSGADQVVLRGEPSSGLAAARMAGSFARFGAGGKKEPFFVRCAGRSCDGAMIDLLVEKGGPLELTVVGVHFGLPAAAAPLVAARPPNAQPQYSPDSSFAIDRVRL